MTIEETVQQQRVLIKWRIERYHVRRSEDLVLGFVETFPVPDRTTLAAIYNALEVFFP